jgi:hypothetical protein
MRFSICLAISVFVIACAQQPPTRAPTPPQPVNCPGMTSPDQQLRACVLSVGTHPNPPFNESRVEIRNMGGTVLATKDFKSPEASTDATFRKWSGHLIRSSSFSARQVAVGIRPGIGRLTFTIANEKHSKKWTTSQVPSSSETSN